VLTPEVFKWEPWAKPFEWRGNQWEYRKIKKYPPEDADWSEIKEFIQDAKLAERKIEFDLIKKGVPRKEAVEESCQWPLTDDAPEEAVRSFIAYNNMIQDTPEGMDP